MSAQDTTQADAVGASSELRLITLAAMWLPVEHLARVSEPRPAGPTLLTTNQGEAQPYLVRDVTQLCDGRTQPWEATTAEKLLLTTEEVGEALAERRTCRACAAECSRLLGSIADAAQDELGTPSLLDLLADASSNDADADVATTGQGGGR